MVPVTLEILRKILPPYFRVLLNTIKFYVIFSRRYGHLKSRLKNDVIAADGNCLPWYTYPTIEYLNGLDFSKSSVFEYGCGNSTVYWSNRAKSVTSVEHNKEYMELVLSKVSKNNVNIVYESDLNKYPDVIAVSGIKYDIVIIDGKSSTRTRSALLAIRHLSSKGFIILDNSDRYPKTSQFLRDKDLIQVDLHGMLPKGVTTNTTSLFLRREFVVSPLYKRLPIDSICGQQYVSIHDAYPEE